MPLLEILLIRFLLMSLQMLERFKKEHGKFLGGNDCQQPVKLKGVFRAGHYLCSWGGKQCVQTHPLTLAKLLMKNGLCWKKRGRRRRNFCRRFVKLRSRARAEAETFKMEFELSPFFSPRAISSLVGNEWWCLGFCRSDCGVFGSWTVRCRCLYKWTGRKKENKKEQQTFSSFYSLPPVFISLLYHTSLFLSHSPPLPFILGAHNANFQGWFLPYITTHISTKKKKRMINDFA